MKYRMFLVAAALLFCCAFTASECAYYEADGSVQVSLTQPLTQSAQAKADETFYAVLTGILLAAAFGSVLMGAAENADGV